MALAINTTSSQPAGDINFNVFLKLLKVFDDQKNEVQMLGKMAILGTIALKNSLYEAGMKQYEEAVAKISEMVESLRAAIEAKKNESPGVFERIGGLVLDVGIAIAIGAVIGPIAIIVGAIAGLTAFTLSYLNENKTGLTLSFFKKGDDLEQQQTTLEVQTKTEQANLTRQKATQHKNEISMTLDTEFNPLASMAEQVANLMTRILRAFGEMANSHGRG